MSPEKLVYMANQIGRFFAHKGKAEATASTADHLKKFWDPRMRKAIFDYVEAGGEGLEPFVKDSILSLGRKAPALPSR
jgi:formate dehydrogenase subunit delta